MYPLALFNFVLVEVLLSLQMYYFFVLATFVLNKVIYLKKTPSGQRWKKTYAVINKTHFLLLSINTQLMSEIAKN